MNPAFEDAHTLLLPASANAGKAQNLHAFPLKVRLNSRDELVVQGNWSTQEGHDKISSGALVKQINGQATSRLLDDLELYGHGETEELRRHMLGVMFPSWLSAVKGWSDTFRLEIEQDGSRRSVLISAGDSWTSDALASQAEAPSLRDLGGGTWLLDLPTFDVDDDPASYRTAIDKAFSTLRDAKASGLILDVRGNTGGQSDAGAQVIRFLADKPINQVSRARERLNQGNRGIFGYKGRVGDMREMDLSRDGLIKPAPKSERFNGNVVLLVDAMTYSAGILFATTLQDHGLAVLVGRPTGGFANQTGNMESITLPNTGLEAFIPARIFVRPNGDDRLAPVIPDILNPLGEAAGDADLRAAMEHIRNRRMRPGRRNTDG
jgi:hypothetical protein